MDSINSFVYFSLETCQLYQLKSRKEEKKSHNLTALNYEITSVAAVANLWNYLYTQWREIIDLKKKIQMSSNS